MSETKTTKTGSEREREREKQQKTLYRLNRTLDSRSEIKLNEIYIKTVLFPARGRERKGGRESTLRQHVRQRRCWRRCRPARLPVKISNASWLRSFKWDGGIRFAPFPSPLYPSSCTKSYALKHEKCDDHRSSSGSSSRTRAGLNSSVKTMRETAATVWHFRVHN